MRLKTAVTPLSKPVTSAKSLRIYQQGADGKYHQATCSPWTQPTGDPVTTQ
jgi:hypothetical protein